MLTNLFPVPIEIRGIALVNSESGAIVVNKGDINTPSEWITIQPDETETITFNLAGVT